MTKFNQRKSEVAKWVICAFAASSTLFTSSHKVLCQPTANVSESVEAGHGNSSKAPIWMLVSVGETRWMFILQENVGLEDREYNDGMTKEMGLSTNSSSSGITQNRVPDQVDAARKPLDFSNSQSLMQSQSKAQKKNEELIVIEGNTEDLPVLPSPGGQRVRKRPSAPDS